MDFTICPQGICRTVNRYGTTVSPNVDDDLRCFASPRSMEQMKRFRAAYRRKLMPAEGVEPTHSFEYKILSLARLPISPHRL